MTVLLIRPARRSIQFRLRRLPQRSIPIGRPGVRVRSFAAPSERRVLSILRTTDRRPQLRFSAADEISTRPRRRIDRRDTRPRPSEHARRTRTRIRPPGDVIKLEDRLLYISAAVAGVADRPSGRWSLPFAPFPFQFEGVAFLYPRHAAILADEMGLGKTMQAITAIRLLLRRGEMRSVLLVCPKPLVTNWQREFAHWAPEIPLLVDRGRPGRGGPGSGNCPTCRCGSPTTNCSCRDRESSRTSRRLRGRCVSTWWSSTNRSGSRTAPAPPAKWSAPSAAAAVGR